ncbi:hypothetical protein CURTO8I2_320087 [Curtobacterium sp. 8I-2]|nr:hypothetical protein CURTO8I2_320087 [Curtobacterium sp. 8I-2]
MLVPLTVRTNGPLPPARQYL